MKSNGRRTLKMEKKTLIKRNEEILCVFFSSTKMKDYGAFGAVQLHSSEMRWESPDSVQSTCTLVHTYVQFAWLRTHYKNASDYYDDDHILWQHRIILAMAFSFSFFLSLREFVPAKPISFWFCNRFLCGSMPPSQIHVVPNQNQTKQDYSQDESLLNNDPLINDVLEL